MDEEKKEQLKYDKAKIFIKVIEKESHENRFNGIDDKVKIWLQLNFNKYNMLYFYYISLVIIFKEIKQCKYIFDPDIGNYYLFSLLKIWTVSYINIIVILYIPTILFL